MMSVDILFSVARSEENEAGNFFDFLYLCNR